MKKIQLGGHRKGFAIRGYAIVDDEDFERLNRFVWYTGCASYAITRTGRKNKKQLFMHRLIMNTPAGMDTDHINGNKLDNRRANLRICSHSENCMNRKKSSANTSGFTGVVWKKKLGKWRVKLCGKYLGEFLSKEKAALVYNEAAKKRFGEFARLNEI